MPSTRPARVARALSMLFTMTAGALLATACGPSDIVGKQALEPMREGLPLDSIPALLAQGPLTPLQPADSLRLFHGYRTQIFVVNGDQYRVVWYREQPGSIEETITRERETPILLKEERVIGHGWAFYDKQAETVGLPNPYRAKERLDSIAQSQQAKP